MRLVPPFRTLDPALATAEQLLSSGDRRLSAVFDALPDEQAAATRLNEVLADCGAGPRLRVRDGVWQVVWVAAVARDTELVVAASGLAALVALAGWRRLKCCDVCGTPYVDRTNGCSRRWCAAHRPHAER